MRVTGKNIQYYLDNGLVVNSRAIGRIGRVTRVEGEAVYIRLRNGREGVTTFARGDKVVFVCHPDFVVDIVNEDFA